MKVYALIQKRTEYGNRSFSSQQPGESKEAFISRIKKAYQNPVGYWEVEFIEGEEIDSLG